LVLQFAVFVALCEGYLGIRPNFALWKYYFGATIFLKIARREETVPVHIGRCGSSFIKAGRMGTSP
jgi:hypothetical protein